MGRKSRASRKEETAVTPGGSNPSTNEAKSQPESTQTESPNTSSKKRPMIQCVVVRRSGRLRNILSPTPHRDVGPVIEQIESDEEDEPCAEVEKEPLRSNLGEKSLEEKVEYLLQCLEALEKTIRTPNSKANRRPLQSDGSSARYKSLYFNSQHKIEALTAENHQLSNKLEVALGKLEVYEKDAHMRSEWMDKVTEVLLASNLTKAIDFSLQASSRMLGDFASPAAAAEPRTTGIKRKTERESCQRTKVKS